jgi:hypothetical protein
MWWLVRAAVFARWKAGDAEKAAKDLRLREDEQGLSVYRVDDRADAERVAVLFAMYARTAPGDCDYVLIPERCVAPFRVVPKPDESLPAWLGDRHYEIEGLRDVEGASVALARAIFADEESHPARLREAQVLVKAAELIEEQPDCASVLGPDWRNELDAYRKKRDG